MTASDFRRSLLSLLMPIECLGCGTEVDWICPNCRQELPLHRQELCFCGKSSKDGLCDQHRARLGLDCLTTLFSYSKQPIRKLIAQIKYRGYTDGVNFLARHYQKKTLVRLPRGEWIVTFIPLSRTRQRQRGFNQSKLLAQKLTSPLYDCIELLVKKRETIPQVKLTKQLRKKNLLRSLAIKPGVAIPEQVILVDDVVTTGSTLKEAARVLRKAGVKQIWGLTLAHG